MLARSDPIRRGISDGERVDVVDVFVPEDDLAVEAVLVHDFEHEDEVVVGARQELRAADHGQVWGKNDIGPLMCFLSPTEYILWREFFKISHHFISELLHLNQLSQ